MTLEQSSLTARTDDGVSLSVRRYRDPLLPSLGAVMMQHGLGSNGAVFMVPGVSLAEHLAGLGYDCFVTELRGAGGSERPRSYGLDEYLEQDVPALLRTALDASGHGAVSFIGHSMGGILGLAYAIENPAAPLSRVVTVASSLDYRPGKNVYQSLNRIRPIATLLPVVPFRGLARLVSNVAGVGPRLMPESMNFYRPNVDRAVSRQVLSQGFEPIPMRLLDALATTFDARGLSRAAGRIVYAEHAARFTLPTLLLGGSRDPQCTVEAIAATSELLSGAREKHARMFGRAYGQSEDYGHFDLFVGKRAPDEVWPVIVEFLARGRLASSELAGDELDEGELP